MVDKERVSRRFSEHAESYEEHAQVQGILGETLLRHLGDPEELARPAARVLEVGSGTGRMTRALLERFPTIVIDAVDLSAGMVEKARRTTPGQRVRFLCGDIETMLLAGPYAAVVSSATFQWFDRPAETVPRLVEALAPGGTLAFSTFGSLTFRELRAAFEEAARRLARPDVAYPGLSFLSAPQIAALVPPSAAVAELHEELLVTQHLSVRDFLRSVRRVGATGSGGRPIPLALLLETERVYKERFAEPRFVPATYHAIWAIVRKAISGASSS